MEHGKWSAENGKQEDGRRNAEHGQDTENDRIKNRMMWFFYNLLFFVGYMIMLPKFFIRMKKRGGYKKGFLQRVGVYAPEIVLKIKDRRRIWLHAVSVGEVYIALCFIEEIRRTEPGACFVFTVTTTTGHRIAAKHLSGDDVLLYFPADFPVVVRRVLSLINPRALILTEGEIWPNLIRLAAKKKVPIFLINGRMSESSYRGYKHLRAFFSRIVECMTLLLVQTQGDADRYISLGADPQRIRVVGSAKYDADRKGSMGGDNILKIFQACGINSDDLIIAGGSTWPGEERILLEVFKKLKEKFTDLKLVLVPRHAERREEVESEIRRVNLSYIKRSDVSDAKIASVDVLLVDTTGELMQVYNHASVVFVGKSLTCHGGQNIIEPAMFAKPVFTGPNLENFPVIAEDFRAGEAIIQVAGQDELYARMCELLGDAGLRKAWGEKARQVVESRKGVVEKSVREIMGNIQA